jgi:hypothetical protein
MKKFNIIEEPTFKQLDYIIFGGEEILVYNEISDIEFSLLADDINLDLKKYKSTDFVYAKLANGVETYIFKKDINETEYLTKDEAVELAIDFVDFMSKNPEITFNPVIKKWSTNIGIGYQTTKELFRIYEANKSKLTANEFSNLLHDMVQASKKLNDEKLIESYVNEVLEKYPDLLRYRDYEWFLNQCKA